MKFDDGNHRMVQLTEAEKRLRTLVRGLDKEGLELQDNAQARILNKHFAPSSPCCKAGAVAKGSSYIYAFVPPVLRAAMSASRRVSQLPEPQAFAAETEMLRRIPAATHLTIF